ncbi:Structural maintenance of chromosomes protein 2 [Fasciola hepatica]|uniref:Structural maintenance of chromosomes protein 2 n=1 Tax=Fasciola hepatica TaxID=6192 RepID=A0A4E0RKH6_FASHE|nr:Structural maintenance of chromosomes protein 2 [Fasciola hepatica]
MRQKHLKNELTKQEAAVAQVFGRLSMTGGKSKEEIEQQRLSEEIESLTQRLSRAEADDKAVGSESTISERQLGLVKEAREARHQANSAAAQFPHLQFDYTQPEPNFDRRRVYGPVAKLIQVKDLKYATALEVAAGPKLYNIVVACDKTGKLLLERGQLRRRVTMLPLNQIRGTVIPPAVVKQAETVVGATNVATALSLVTYPPELQPAMEYVFGNVLVCPDLDIARKVAFHPGVERRTVTLEGDVFDPQGTLSGGSRAPALDSLLAKLAHWRQLEDTAAKAEEEVSRGESNLQAAQKRTQDIAQLREALASARHKLGILEGELRLNDQHRLKADVLATREELGQVEEALKQAKARLTQACQRADQAHTKMVNAVAEREREKREAETALNQAKKQVEASASALREKTAVKETLRLEAEDLAKELNTINISLQEANKALETAITEADRCALEAKTAIAALSEAREAVNRQRALIDETVKALAAAEKRGGQLVQSINKVTAQIDKLTHQLEVQTKESEEAGNKIDHLMELHPWIAEERQHFGVENGAYCFNSRNPSEARSRIQSLRERRDRLSRTVNMRAMNMLGSAEEQYAELIKRQEIVLADKRKIQAVIDDLDKRKREVLMSAYNKVNEEFCNIFSTLLPGSKARLFPPENLSVLDGLEIKVAFGDVWKESLSELSGGQRSLAALSLILALLLFKPAPLYILDEVDAALDLSHTQNIGQLIKHHFQHSQFLIVSLKDGMFNNANVLFKTKFQDGVSTVTRHVPLRVAGSKHMSDENRAPEQERQRRKVR